MIKPSQEIVDQAYVKDYEKLYREVQQDPEAFWENIAHELLWFKPWDKVLDWNYPYARWFVGGQCNIIYNALDRHQKTPTRDKLAYIWQGQPSPAEAIADKDGPVRTFTYGELDIEVCKFANVLKSLGVRKGDRVSIYLPRIPEQFIAMLACAKIGAIHSVVFSGFSADALKNRIMDAQSKIVITTDRYPYKDKILESKKTVDEAIKDIKSVEYVIVVDRINQKNSDKSANIGSIRNQKNPDKSEKNPISSDLSGFPMSADASRILPNSSDSLMQSGRDLWYHELMAKADTICSTEIMEATDPLFLLYTSGSTGKPKGVLHSHGGYMVGTYITLKWVFDLKSEIRNPKSETNSNDKNTNDQKSFENSNFENSKIVSSFDIRASNFDSNDEIWFCTADAGWITGHSYIVYSPLMNGATTFVYEGTPDYPHPGIWWELIEKYKISKFYTAPTAIRALMRLGDEIPNKYDLSSLQILGTVGEPINPEAWLWYYKTIGKENCPIMDTWWQTETGMFMLTPLPSVPLKPGSCFKPFFGVEADVVDDKGNSVPVNSQGYLVIKKPWPAMLLDVYNNPEKYRETYFEKLPNPKSQFPNKSQIQNPNDRNVTGVEVEGLLQARKTDKVAINDQQQNPINYLSIDQAPITSTNEHLWEGNRDRPRDEQTNDFSDFLYFTGDSAKKDEDGYFWIIGRNDDVIKVSGHRLGSAELESAFVSHSSVAEAAVIGKPDEIKGEKIKAFVILKLGQKATDQLKDELKKHVRKMIGPIATPDEIEFVNQLPKTRSGKIMRRVLKAKELGQPLGDTSTLEN